MIFFIGLLASLIRRKKRKKISSEDDRKQTIAASTFLSLAIIVFTLVIAYKVMLSDDDSEPADTETNSNPYTYTNGDHDCSDFDTQEDAQLFYEANGGPEEHSPIYRPPLSKLWCYQKVLLTQCPEAFYQVKG